MKRILFIDRDGTLIKEPADEQIDAFEKLEFLPGMFNYLGRIARELDFELVMVTNQDGLGTASFPEETFWPVHHFIINTLAAEDIHFENQLIDRNFAADNAPTRQPNLGLVQPSLSGEYDIVSASTVSGKFVAVPDVKCNNSALPLLNTISCTTPITVPRLMVSFPVFVV